MTMLSPGTYRGFQRLADRDGRFSMIAIDQRTPLFAPIAAARGTASAPYADVAAVKRVLAQTLAPHATAMLLDPIYAYPACLEVMDPRPGLMLSYEHAAVTETPHGKLSAPIPGWSVPKIRRAGADAVKVLVWYRADSAPDLASRQREFVRAAGEACRAADMVHLLEILVYPLPGEDRATYAARRPELVRAAVADFLDPTFNVDIYKLEPPAPLAGLADPDGPEAAAIQAQYDAMARDLPRPWVLLSAGAGPEDFRRSLVYGYRAGASGYLCGRAIWWEAFRAFPDLAAMAATLEQDAARYLEEINALTARAATPWHAHPGFSGRPVPFGAGPDFPQAYEA